MKGYKTLIFNGLAALMPVMQAGGADLGLTGKAAAIYGLVITVGNVVLRFFTTTPVFKKGDK